MKCIYKVYLFLFINGCLWAQTFGPEQLITGELVGPDNITAGDIDGDTFEDLLIGSRFDDKISWMKNLGNGTFGPLQLIAIGETRNLTLADIDEDTDLDVVVPFLFDDRISWFENLGGLGSFGPEKIIDNSTDQPVEAIAVDLDGDTDLDIVATLDLESRLVWYENLDGNGNFSTRNTIATAITCRAVFAADIDGDDDLDLVTGTAGSATIVWFENLDGQGTFSTQHMVAGPGLFVADVFCIDIDGDNDLDIMGTTNGDNRVAWHENLDGLGNFGPQRIVTNEAISCSTIFCADFDNDEDMDVLYRSTPNAGEETSEVAWSENLDGFGNFGPKQVLGNTLQLVRQVYATDIDKDGDMDVFATSQNNNKVVWYENLTILNVTEVEALGIKMYPNPVKELLVFESPVTINKVTIYSVLGAKLLEVSKNINTLSTASFPTGLLVVELETEKGTVFKKIIKE